jgi:hypothetical protein
MPTRGVKNKRAVSEVVAYVMLIFIGMVIAGIVFSWLLFYVKPDTSPVCEEEVSLALRDYSYDCANNLINLTIENRGLFNVSGYIVRVNNDSTRDIGVYFYTRTGKALAPAQRHIAQFASNKTYDNKNITGIISLVEIQPIKGKVLPEICNLVDDDSDGVADEGCDDNWDNYADISMECPRGEFFFSWVFNSSWVGKDFINGRILIWEGGGNWSFEEDGFNPGEPSWRWYHQHNATKNSSGWAAVIFYCSTRHNDSLDEYSPGGQITPPITTQYIPRPSDVIYCPSTIKQQIVCNV